jgi:hypothetical protein
MRIGAANEAHIYTIYILNLFNAINHAIIAKKTVKRRINTADPKLSASFEKSSPVNIEKLMTFNLLTDARAVKI